MCMCGFSALPFQNKVVKTTAYLIKLKMDIVHFKKLIKHPEYFKKYRRPFEYLKVYKRYKASDN